MKREAQYKPLNSGIFPPCLSHSPASTSYSHQESEKAKVNWESLSKCLKFSICGPTRIDCLLCASPCAKYIRYINSFNPYNDQGHKQ